MAELNSGMYCFLDDGYTGKKISAKLTGLRQITDIVIIEEDLILKYHGDVILDFANNI